MSVGHTLHVVVVGVLGHSSVKEGPGQVVHSILEVKIAELCFINKGKFSKSEEVLILCYIMVKP